MKEGFKVQQENFEIKTRRERNLKLWPNMDINAFNRMLLQSVLILLLLTYYQTIAYRDDTHNVAKRLDSEVCSGKHSMI